MIGDDDDPSYIGGATPPNLPRLGVACHKLGLGERMSFHGNSVGPAPPGHANGMSQSAQSTAVVFLQFLDSRGIPAIFHNNREPFALRISCGARENTHTLSTNTLWHKDFGYTGGRIANAKLPSLITPPLKTLRYFPLSDGPENCYNINNIPRGHYCVRVFFALVAEPNFESEPLFDVSVEGTQIYSLKPGWSTIADQSFVEALIFVTDTSISCCFHSTGHGDPSILSLEILQVDEKEYYFGASWSKEIVLRTAKRLTCGFGKPAFGEDFNGNHWGGDSTVATSGRTLTIALRPQKGSHAIINAIEVFEEYGYKCGNVYRIRMSTLFSLLIKECSEVGTPWGRDSCRMGLAADGSLGQPSEPNRWTRGAGSLGWSLGGSAGGFSLAWEEVQQMAHWRATYWTVPAQWCSKLVNLEAIHGALRSFLDLPGILDHILTFRDFPPYLDMYKGSCRYLTVRGLGAACRKPGSGERTSFHRKGIGPAPPGRANGMSQASRLFLDFSEWFRVFPSLVDFSGYSCHLSAYLDFFVIC
ncbi:hypothetical protein Taro_018160 [Colocasia esculenta]|uniref:Malectin-like domain-containing protein n=1 Tax=Colocasia esculenta TaxID=4460 RepID=A0A843V1L4_COLES|nr:hypothetical protein [Colocasia esculenta]